MASNENGKGSRLSNMAQRLSRRSFLGKIGILAATGAAVTISPLQSFIRRLFGLKTSESVATAETRPSSFPSAGIDVVYHKLRVQVDVGATGTADEVLELLGKMQIQRGDPYTNKDGLRQIDFKVMSWDASGWSSVFKQNITYTLSEGVEQKVSTILSQQPDRDFPATFFFNVTFDVRANNQPVYRMHEGQPELPNAWVVPPDGNRVNTPVVTKFDQTLIRINHPHHGTIQFTPLECADESSRTLVTF